MIKPRRKIRTERRTESILAVLRKQRLTIKELAAEMYMSEDTAREHINRMHGQGLLYVVGFQPVERQKPAKVYAAGNRPDAIHIPKKKPPKPNRREVWKAQVLEALALPGTTKQIAERLGLSYAYARAHIYSLKSERKIHITAWVLPADTGTKAAVYKAGYGQDREFIRTRGAYNRSKPAITPPPAHSIFAALFAQPSTALPL